MSGSKVKIFVSSLVAVTWSIETFTWWILKSMYTSCWVGIRLGLGSVFGSVCGNQDREKEIKRGIDETGYHSSIYVHG